MHPAFILAELRCRGITYRDIANRCNVSTSAVYNTIHRKWIVSQKVKDEIARAIDLPVEEIWPEEEPEAAAVAG